MQNFKRELIFLRLNPNLPGSNPPLLSFAVSGIHPASIDSCCFIIPPPPVSRRKKQPASRKLATRKRVASWRPLTNGLPLPLFKYVCVCVCAEPLRGAKAAGRVSRLGVWAEEGLLMVVRQMPLRDTSLLPRFYFIFLFLLSFLSLLVSVRLFYFFIRGGYKFLSIQIRFYDAYYRLPARA